MRDKPAVRSSCSSLCGVAVHSNGQPAIVNRPSPVAPRPSSGSVLVFAVIILALLAMIGMTFLVIVRQASRASNNALATNEAELAVQSGIHHAVVPLREMVATYSIVTRDGVFAPGGAAFKYTNLDYWKWENSNYTDPVGAPPAPNVYWHFESIDPHTPALSAIADSPSTSSRFTLAFDNSGYLNAPTPAYLTPLRSGGIAISVTPPGSLLPVTEEHAHQIKLEGATSDFYRGLTTIKELPRIGAMRGDYYVWIADLDAKLYAVPRRWFIDTLGMDDVYPNSASWADVVRQRILAFEYPAGNPTVRLLEKPAAAGDPDVATDLLALTPNVGAARDLRCPDFATNKDIALALPSLVQAWDAADNAYLAYENADAAGRPAAWEAYVLARDKYLLPKSDFDAYFSVYRDTPAGGETPFDHVKDDPVAVNINTAPVEVIAAMLSQIPIQRDGDTLYSDAGASGERAWRLAQRIVAKRPFLCRMDFEDFLAAHIRGKVSEAPDPGDNNESFTPPTSLALGTDADEYSFAAMLYYAIDKRWGPQTEQTLTDPVFKSPELSLSGYLEISGVPSNAPQFKANINNADAWPNWPIYQKMRFLYFFADQYIRLGPNSVTTAAGDDVLVVRKDAAGAVAGGMILPGPDNVLQTAAGAGDALYVEPYPRYSANRPEWACLAPKEFNNVINSLTSTTFTDDVQMLPLGSTAPYDTIVIAPGPNGTLETAAQGDDVAVSYIKRGELSTTMPVGDDDLDDGLIKPGPNHVLDTPPDAAQGDTVIPGGIAAGPNAQAETSLPRGRPSYYSFMNDATYAEVFWTTHPASATPIANTLPEWDAAKHMRFYYRLQVKTLPGVPPTYDWEDAVLCDAASPTNQEYGLMSWSCYPDVGSERKPGFYQMNFTDWTPWSFTTPYSYGYGPMLAQGDPDNEEFWYDSTARRTSGSQGNGDVSWSPQVAFRSRYFGIYVLGRGMVRGWGAAANAPVRITGERRMEAVYDALKDEVIWQRAPASDKRSLADP